MKTAPSLPALPPRGYAALRTGHASHPHDGCYISLYRDDLTEILPDAKTADCYFPESVREKTVVIVDDVIYTGRTTRAAIEAVFAEGRPRAIQLAVLIDRGHRELPIKPDYVGKNGPTSHDEIISVGVEDIDGYYRVVLEDKNK